MKVCNSEAMKMIKVLEAELRGIRADENSNCQVSYKEGETKQTNDYNYKNTRQETEQINKRIRDIKHALAVANSTYIIDDFNITIGEALVYLAQLNNEYTQINHLSDRNKISRRLTMNGTLEYTECLYEPEEAKKDQKALF